MSQNRNFTTEGKSLKQFLFWRWWNVMNEIGKVGDSYDLHCLATDLEEAWKEGR